MHRSGRGRGGGGPSSSGCRQDAERDAADRGRGARRRRLLHETAAAAATGSCRPSTADTCTRAPATHSIAPCHNITHTHTHTSHVVSALHAVRYGKIACARRHRVRPYVSVVRMVKVSVTPTHPAPHVAVFTPTPALYGTVPCGTVHGVPRRAVLRQIRFERSRAPSLGCHVELRIYQQSVQTVDASHVCHIN